MLVAGFLTTLLLALPGSLATLTMLKDEMTLFGQPGESIDLECQPTDFPDACTFVRPDGQKLCPPSDEEEYYYGTDSDEECVEDPNADIRPPSTKCVLHLDRIVPELHMGVWKCQPLAWDDTGEATITLKESEALAVELVEVWGEINLELGVEQSFTCQIYLDDGSAVQTAPEMTWSLGDDIIKTSSEYKSEEDGSKSQTIIYNPRLQDNKKSLACSIAQGSKDIGDKIELTMTMFKVEGDSEPTDVVEGLAATLSREFSAFPQVTNKDVHWELDTPKGPIKLRPGSTNARFSSSEVKSLGNNRYSIDLSMKKVFKRDDEVEHKLVVDLASQNDEEPMEIPVTMRVLSQEGAVVAASTPKPNEKSQPGEVTSAADSTTNPPNQTAQSGISLYIIIAILALVVILCCCFYCTKCFKKKKGSQEEGDVEAGADVEANRPLMDESKNDRSAGLEAVKQPLGSAQDEKGVEEAQKKTEQELLNKLDPEPEPVTYADENQQITKMAETLRHSQGSEARSADSSAEEAKQEVDNMVEGVTTLTEGAPESVAKREEELNQIPDELPKSTDEVDEAAKRKKDWANNPLYRQSTEPPTRSSTTPVSSHGGSTTSLKSTGPSPPPSVDLEKEQKIADEYSKILAEVQKTQDSLDQPDPPEAAVHDAQYQPERSPVKRTTSSVSTTGTQTPGPMVKGKKFSFNQQSSFSSDDEEESKKDRSTVPEQSLHIS